MLRYPVRADKQDELRRRFEELGVVEGDLEEWFVRAEGRGGQKRNKTSNCVCLHHKPTGILVRCGASRSQALNRFLARRRLAERLEQAYGARVAEEQRLRHKVRRRKARARRRALKKVGGSGMHRAPTESEDAGW